MTLKSKSTLNGTLRIKAYGNHTKRTLIILRYKYLRTLIGLHSRHLNNYSDVMEYGSLMRASQYHKHCTTLLMRTTVRNGQMQKSSYILTTKDPLIRMLSTVVLNYAHLPLGHLNHLLHLHPSKLLRLHKLRLHKLRPRKLRPHKPRPRKLRPRKLRPHRPRPRKLR